MGLFPISIKNYKHLMKIFDFGNRLTLRVNTGHTMMVMPLTLQEAIDRELGITNCVAQNKMEVIGVGDISYE